MGLAASEGKLNSQPPYQPLFRARPHPRGLAVVGCAAEAPATPFCTGTAGKSAARLLRFLRRPDLDPSSQRSCV